MSSSFVRVELKQSHAILTINREDKLNALSSSLLEELHDVIESLAKQKGLFALIITGAGQKAFVAGADIAEMKEMSPREAKRFAQKGHALCRAIEKLPFPAIAAVNGYALGGGCELALACDFIYASTNAKFGQPELKLGLIPGFGATFRLAERVGIAKARELIYTGATIDAEEAFRIGLVNKLFAPETLLQGAEESARAIAQVGPQALALAKRTLRKVQRKAITEAIPIEIKAFAKCFESEESKEGMSAFLEKRKARFTESLGDRTSESSP
ncbi:MAG: enoyl-CoA hydratase-related protein [Sandaracinaceae bacterium]|nr:enoyl-CoA hydratase-related protein [Sandaracinaceae bacterium]MDW8246061.1 enoyl-CoA hydratase-related protein [Sandaracinaceae bacterium]